MRIAIYYDNRLGRNDGPPLYYYHVLKDKLGLDCKHLIPQGDTRKDCGDFDFHFWVDWGEDALHYPEFEIPKDGGKTIYVASDTHLDGGYRLNKAKKFDYVFFNQRKAVYNYEKLTDRKKGQKIEWLPHAFEPEAYPHIETLKKYDVCFIGHIQEDKPNFNGFSRMKALDILFREFPNFYYGSRHPAYPGKELFEDAARHMSQSKIVFNISIADDVNMRVFEVMGTRSFLMTNYIPTLKHLFEDGKDLVTYNTIPEMVRKVSYYLNHDKKRIKIAETGYNNVIKNHTYQNRVEHILKLIKAI
jgi:glycosyltransferase involved in cell wall biosynthesis